MILTLPPAVSELIGALERAGYPAYVVGGCVRDGLMGRTPYDWDICTAATPEQMAVCLEGYRLLPTGIRHGTLTALVGGMPYEITTLRADGAYTDHRRPDAVRYVGDLREDLARRDFTINAMAYHPREGLTDPFGGREDLARKLVRCVGDPIRRFDEDALRILRALRFAAVCGFTVDPSTAKAMRAQSALLAHIARERVRAEAEKLLAAPEPARGLDGFADVLRAAMPGLRPLTDDPAAWARAVARIQAVAKRKAERAHSRALQRAAFPGVSPSAVPWTALLWELEPPEAASALLRGLRCDNATRACVEALLGAREMPLSGERALLCGLRALDAHRMRALLAVRTADADGNGDRIAALSETADTLEGLLEKGACYRTAHLAVHGGDLLALGLKGATVGRTLEALLTEVIEGRAPNERGALLRRARGEV